jgi:phospholipid-binding lipoprotein MlaA
MSYLNRLTRFVLLITALALGGCATGNNPQDPFEGFNRAMFKFNDALDEAALKPAATAYQEHLPSFLQTAIGNFFGNIGDVWTAVNNLLQGKVEQGLTDVMRVAVNTTLGFGGLLDISSEAGLQKHKEDFGQTLGKWGMTSGPYVVLPLLGPSTMRDTAALPLDVAGNAWTYVRPTETQLAGSLVHIVDTRASLLGASTLLEEIALDRYTFVRDAYLQRRKSMIYDGNVPPSKKEEDQESTLRNDLQPPAAGLPVVTILPSAEPNRHPLVEREQKNSHDIRSHAVAALSGPTQ